jgi:preprotein translocase subunit SecF
VEFTFLKNTNIDFVGKRYIFFALSALMMLAGIAALVLRGGPNYSIDFSGGILVQVAFTEPVNIDQVRSALNTAVGKVELQSSKNSVIIRQKKSEINQDEFSSKVITALREQFPNSGALVERTEFVGPAVGKHLAKQAFYAIIFSFLGIIVYVAFRFHSGIWGMAGVLGIIHDVFVVFGFFAIVNKEISLTSIAAFLTIAGYSINDTIVIFDRMRENMRFLAKDDLGTIINRSVNQTLSRTLMTSLTVLLVVTALFFFGGEGIHDFAFAMVFGTVIGSYSTIYVCTPIVYEWELQKKNRMKKLQKGGKG